MKKIISATATTTVQIYKSKIYDEPKEGPTLAKAHLEESFKGDIEGNGVVETLQVIDKATKSLTFVGIQRFNGKIGEKNGTFLLQVTGKVIGKINISTWFVIPESGTDQLLGLRGKGGFKAKLGEGGEVVLDYWFE